MGGSRSRSWRAWGVELVFLARVLKWFAPKHRSKPGPCAADARRPHSPRAEQGSRFLPGSVGSRQASQAGGFAPGLAAKESHLRRPLASAELNPHLERAPPPQFPAPALSLWVRNGRRQGSCQGSTSKQCLLACTYLGELFAVTSHVLPPRKTMSSHRSTLFFFSI